MPNQDLIEREIESARKKLLDLTMRNRLLNYKPSRAKTLRIVEELPSQVFDILVTDSKHMVFKPKPQAESRNAENLALEVDKDEENSGLTKAESDILWQPAKDKGSLASKHTDRYLQTFLDVESLQKRLFKINSLSASFFEEQGYSVLFLAIGFLKWKETTNSEFRNAPLILIPVELKRERVGAPFHLVWTGDEILGNISLIEKLKEQFVDLPEFIGADDENPIDKYFTAVRKAIKNCVDWNIADDICLDFFSFTKFILWRDLDKKSWPKGSAPSDHKLIQLLLDSETTQETIEPFDEDRADDLLLPESIFHVVDADPSQIAVIEDTKAGINLVVEGPPGTGKSQTITNTIAELLANGKTVLFVSEKMAALEVVKNRLDKVGLGDYCLELHSRKTKKKEFYLELKRSFDSKTSRLQVDPYEFQKLKMLRDQLNEYVTAIRTPIGGLSLSPYQAFAKKEKVLRHFLKHDRVMPAMPIPNVQNISPDIWDASQTKLRDLVLALRIVEPVHEHPWKDINPEVILPDDEKRIGEQIDDCLDHLESLTDRLNELVEYSGVVCPTTLPSVIPTLAAAHTVANSRSNAKSVLLNAAWNQESSEAVELLTKIRNFQAGCNAFDCSNWSWNISRTQLDVAKSRLESCSKLVHEIKAHAIHVQEFAGTRDLDSLEDVSLLADAADLVATAPAVDEVVLNNEKWNGGNDEANGIITLLEQCQNKKTMPLQSFRPDIFSKDNSTIILDYFALSVKFSRFVLPKYYKLRSQIRSWLLSKDLKEIEWRDPLQRLLDYYEVSQRVVHADPVAISYFDGLWRGEESDCSQLKSFVEWIVPYRAAHKLGLLSVKSHSLTRLNRNGETFVAAISSFRNSAFEFLITFTELESLMGRNISELTRKPVEKLSIGSVDTLLVIIRNWIAIQRSDQCGQDLFGRLWLKERSDVELLSTFSNWVVTFRRELLLGLISERSCELIDLGISNDIVVGLSKQVEQLHGQSNECLRTLAIELRYDVKSLVSLGLRELVIKLHMWRGNLDSLQYWSRFKAVQRSCIGPVVEPLLALVFSGQLSSADDVIPTVEGNYADSLIRFAFRERPLLSEFSGDVQNTKIKEFVESDRSAIRLNQLRVGSFLANNRPTLYQQSSRTSEAGILLDQFNRQRKLMPIRQLMAHCGGLVQRIKPCLMMSPLSIAQFLDPLSAKFDVIIFDEASQVRPEDALGALMRGDQLIVMGDTRQLPPTSFFDHVSEEEAEEEDSLSTSVSDVESILHQCKRRFPVRMLSWHYRSRHDSLIAVSNFHFYDNLLQVFPAPRNRISGVGLHHMYFSDSVYDRGNSSVNRQEARAVAKAALDCYLTQPSKSLGIGTFNLKQQEAIKREIELICVQNPQYAEFFTSGRDEHFFVKNLETIQGDERDTILISVGYGFDSVRKLSKNFGPLNKDGGERRLNVLITRAREHCIVFSNFRAQDLPIENNDSFGVRALKDYLQYAETGIMPHQMAFRSDTDSPFEDSVREFIVSHGFEVRPQVGCARYWIDLAVVNPSVPGTYLLGIECDGAMYHTSRVARERDRLRQDVLESLGWRLHRIWSTDWYRNRTHTQRKILEAIDLAKIGAYPTRLEYQKDFNASVQMKEIGDDELALDNQTTTPDESVTSDFVFAFPDYDFCDSIPLAYECELHELEPKDIARAVTKVVSVECPIHPDEVINRIRTLCGFARAGQRMQGAIKTGISYAISKEYIKRIGGFLWVKDEMSVAPRKRNTPTDFAYICDTEILEAIIRVLRIQFSTTKQDLAVQTTRQLGYQRTTDDIRKRVESIISRAIRNTTLKSQSNGTISLP